MEYVIGLDLGTTNCKAVAMSEDGKILRTSSSSYSLHYPHPGWVEQNPDDIWSGAQKTIQGLDYKSIPGDLVNICISGAMHSIFPIDKNDQILAPAMTWADQRATNQVQEIQNSIDETSIYHRSGCPLNFIYHAPKIRWWFDKAPQIASKTAKFVAIKDYIIFKLTGKWITDRGLASTTGLLDIRTGRWIPELLNLAYINIQHLPDLVWSSEKVGGVTREASLLTNVPENILVFPGTHDGGLANIGAGANSYNQIVITVGTSGAVRKFVEEPEFDDRQRTWCYLTQKEQWLVGGAINNGGLSVKKVKNLYYNFVGDNGYAQLYHDASCIPPGSEGLLILPYFSGERSPHWDPNVRASIFGLGLIHNRAHFARAILEGVAYCIKDVHQALISSKDVNPETNDIIYLTGGITKSPIWIQILSDVLGVALRSVEIADASAIGAAFLGLQSSGIKPIKEHSMVNYFGKTYLPISENHSLYNDIYQIFVNKYSPST